METKPPEKKGILRKIKENVDDHDEQMQILGAMVRLGSYLVWFYRTLNYVELPMVKDWSIIRYHVCCFDLYGSPTFGLSTGNKSQRQQNNENS